MPLFATSFPLINFPAVAPAFTVENDTLWMYSSSPENSNAPSFDLDCLELQTFLKISKHDFDVKSIAEPEASPNKKLPFLMKKDGSVFNKNQAIDQFSEDVILRTKQASGMELEALSILLENTLKQAIKLALWSDYENYKTYTIPLYSGSRPYPIGELVCSSIKNQVFEEITTKQSTAFEEIEINDAAEECLDALSKYLGDNDYFSKSGPGYLDAAVFACVHTIMTYPGHSKLKQSLSTNNSYSTLLDHSQRILNTFFQV